MTWQCFRVTYDLHSPLHIGYHKVGNVQRTRHYIPARNLWGAVTEYATRGGFSTENAPEGDYRAIGTWVRQHCALSYFFLCEGDNLLVPLHTDNGPYYGDLSQAAFERRYLSAHVTTALDAATTSAKDGSLHEVEFIAPHRLDKTGSGERTQLRGWVFLDDRAQEHWGAQEKWECYLATLHVGGERRYGFGQLRLVDWKEDTQLNGCSVLLDSDQPGIQAPQDAALLAHTLADGVQAWGQIEPLVGRETRESHRFGAHLTAGRVCWTPGSEIAAPATFQIDPGGYWIKHQ